MRHLNFITIIFRASDEYSLPQLTFELRLVSFHQPGYSPRRNEALTGRFLAEHTLPYQSRSNCSSLRLSAGQDETAGQRILSEKILILYVFSARCNGLNRLRSVASYMATNRHANPGHQLWLGVQKRKQGAYFGFRRCSLRVIYKRFSWNWHSGIYDAASGYLF